MKDTTNKIQNPHFSNWRNIALYTSMENPGTTVNMYCAKPEKSPAASSQEKYPAAYPAIEPKNTPKVPNNAYLYAFDILSNVNVKKNIGVGKGKKDASAKAQINNAHAPHLVFAQCIPHSCIDFNQFLILYYFLYSFWLTI